MFTKKPTNTSPASEPKRRLSASPDSAHDPYMFLSRLKKPRLTTITPPWRLNAHGTLDNIIEREFGGGEGAATKRLLRRSGEVEREANQIVEALRGSTHNLLGRWSPASSGIQRGFLCLAGGGLDG